MRLAKGIRTLLVGGSVVGMVVWFASTRSSQAVNPTATNPKPAVAVKVASADDANYVGSDTCKDCHEEVFKA